MASGNLEAPNTQARNGNDWFGDGLDRIFLSVVFMCLAGWMLIPSKYEGLFKMPFVIVLWALLIAHAPIVRWLKWRVTHVRFADTSLTPWTREESFRQYPELFLFIAVFAAFALDDWLHHEPPWIALAVLAAGLGFLWGRFGFSLSIAGLALSGVAAVSLSLSKGPRIACLVIPMAFLYLIKGAMELRQYVHAHPALLA